MTQVKRQPLAEQAAELLLARVRAGEWQLGEKLPGETTLAPQLGVGRSTLREAIQQLAGKGVLATRQGSGVFVTALDVSEGWESKLQSAHIRQIIEARMAIEIEAARLAAERRSPAELRAMRRALETRDAGRGAIESLVDADTAFHRAIVEASQNAILLEMFDTLTPRLRDAMIAMLRARSEFGDAPDHAAHGALCDAIAARDAALAAALSRTHLEELVAKLG